MSANTVTVTILDKEYRVACEPGQEEALLASALHLDQRMRQVRKSGRIIGTERIAVMVALNLTHELMELKARCGDEELALADRLRRLQEQVAVALAEINQLEL